MPRRKAGSRGDGKTIIRVFCEGESEQAYTEYLKRRFSDVAVIAYPKETGSMRQRLDFPKIPGTEIIRTLSMKSGFSLMLRQKILTRGIIVLRS